MIPQINTAIFCSTVTFIPPHGPPPPPPPHLQAPAKIALGSSFQVTLNSSFPTPSGLSNAARFRAVLAQPGFSTHAARHGMRNVILVINAATVSE